MTPPLLQLDGVTLKRGDKLLCENLSLEVRRGETWALLGRNGAGKTTLLHSLLGLQALDAGAVAIQGQALKSYLIKPKGRRQLAQRVGMLFQEGLDLLPATVMETVMLGRYPHSRSLVRDDETDRQVAATALAELDLASLAHRQLETLSGGERQRLALATLITQDPQLYLLDEPSNHLDVAFQVKLLKVLQTRVRKQHAGMIMATHDINLAARFCDHIALLLPSGGHAAGRREEILTEQNLSTAYECPVKSLKEGDLLLFYPS